ncbi:DUF7537 family lipoprotein [Mobilicoccus caccae]|nr:LppX_LprAFG lipoprotein [Mobilicoccus caccae]
MLRQRLAAVLVTVPLALVGCSANGGDSPPAPAATTGAQEPGASPKPGDEVDAAAFFETTQKAMLEAKTYAMTMTMQTAGDTMTMTGTGDLSDQNRPKADMTMSAGGGAGKMRMIMDGESVFMQMPGVAQGGKFVKMPIEALSQAGGQDLSKLMNPAENLKLTQQAVEKVVYQGPEDTGGEQLQRYAVTMNPQKLQGGLNTAAPTAGATAAPESIPYDVWVDDANRMRKMTMSLQGTTMTMTTDKYGEKVDIVAPPAASITQMPGLSGPAPSAPASPSTPATPAAPTS